MSLSSFAIKKKKVIYFAVFLLLVAGVASFYSLGQLEDPEFTVKAAVVITPYPGASPQEVELEVTDRIELALQEMPELDSLYSLSRAGLSIIKVSIKQEYWSDRLPQVWDKMRKNIRDIMPKLPPGVGKPDIKDDFSFVYGFVLAVTGDGFSYAEIEQYAEELKRELSLIKGVSRVELWGVQDKVIYLEVSEEQLALLGLTLENITATISNQNLVVNAGGVDFNNERFRIAPTGAFKTPEDIGNLLIRGPQQDTLVDTVAISSQHTGEVIRVRDIGTVRRGYLEPPQALMRFNGHPAVGISLANIAGSNVVHTGRSIDKRLNELLAELPVGIELHKIAWQSDLVSKSVTDFMINLIEAVGIVMVVLTVSMGWRMGMIIGIDLILTILGTFIFMAVLGIDLQRMSLGALIIALGMMVDNAIVVADGFAVRLKQRMDRTKAAVEATSQSARPLLSATVVAVMAFYPIFASKANGGEFCRTLFVVVAISLSLSWVIAMIFTPVQCLDWMPNPKQVDQEGDIFSGRFYQTFRKLLAKAIRRRWLTLALMIGLLVASIVGFGNVRKMFFSDSSRTQFMVDYWAPESTRIQKVSVDLKDIEAKLLKDPRVVNVSTFIGMGPPRFYLPVDPELPYQSYAQIIVNTHTVQEVHALVRELGLWLSENVPQALTRVRKYACGPSDTWQLEARFIGPGDADLTVLRSLGEESMAILEKCPLAKEIRTDMRQPVKKVVPDYAQERARWAAISREDIARATRRAFDGLTVGLYREGDDLYPIILRQVEKERQKVASTLDALQVQPALSGETVPLSQVTRDISVEWEDPIIVRWNRRRAITVQCAPNGVTFPKLRATVLDEFKQLEANLPPGYELFWDGEYDSSKTAQSSLKPGAIPAVIVMVFVIVALFNAFRPPLIIILTIPFATIGITAGLLSTGAAFGFLALLGAGSLSGMMIKNAVVLLVQIKLDLAAGESPYRAIVDSAVSRLRPVVLAAATTVLGVTPLLQDVFWVSMAVTIMAGLTFGTILTMVVVPVLYATWYRIPSPRHAK
jgi:multidrug efflux pump subunit AcrB